MTTSPAVERLQALLKNYRDSGKLIEAKAIERAIRVVRETSRSIDGGAHA